MLKTNTKIKLSIVFGLILLIVLIVQPLSRYQSSSRNGAVSNTKVIAQGQLPLNNRYNDTFVNAVMKDNILLSLAYLQGNVQNPTQIDWSQVKKSFHFELTLQPSETFAFHGLVLDQYKGKVIKTTNSGFSASEGYKSDGYLFGDGVCHLASIINLVARIAKLDVVSPVTHDFAKINDIPKKYGVSIYTNPAAPESSKLQNLYITNNYHRPIAFVFTYEKNSLQVRVEELN